MPTERDGATARPIDGACYLCGQETISVSGDPGCWSIDLPYEGGNGDKRKYHWRCVIHSIAAVSSHDALVEKCRALAASLRWALKEALEHRAGWIVECPWCKGKQKRGQDFYPIEGYEHDVAGCEYDKALTLLRALGDGR